MSGRQPTFVPQTAHHYARSDPKKLRKGTDHRLADALGRSRASQLLQVHPRDQVIGGILVRLVFLYRRVLLAFLNEGQALSATPRE